MKLKDVLGRIKNSKNNQIIWNPKKRKLRELNLTEEDILNIKIFPKKKICKEVFFEDD